MDVANVRSALGSTEEAASHIVPEPEPRLRVIFKHFKFGPKNAMLVEDGLRGKLKSTIDSGDDLREAHWIGRKNRPSLGHQVLEADSRANVRGYLESWACDQKFLLKYYRQLHREWPCCRRA